MWSRGTKQPDTIAGSDVSVVSNTRADALIRQIFPEVPTRGLRAKPGKFTTSEAVFLQKLRAAFRARKRVVATTVK